MHSLSKTRHKPTIKTSDENHVSLHIYAKSQLVVCTCKKRPQNPSVLFAMNLSIIIHVMNDRNIMSSNLYSLFIFHTLKTYDAGLFFTMAKDHKEGNLKVFVTSEDGIKVSDPNW